MVWFPNRPSSSLSELLDVLVTCTRLLARSVFLSNWQSVENKKKAAIPTDIALFMQQNLHATQILFCQRRYRCPMNSMSKNGWVCFLGGGCFLLLFFYRQHSTRKSRWTELSHFSFYIAALQSLALFLQEHGWPSFPWLNSRSLS